jgi:uncharacterized protein YndB with AHSA1/START domain
MHANIDEVSSPAEGARMNTTAETTTAGYELSITRVFDAPRELVWKAWTDPAMAKQWMGPRGFKVTEYVPPSVEGKRWNRAMEGHRPGSDALVKLRMSGITKVVRPPELMVYTFAWEDRSSVGLGDSPYQENIVTMRLEERGGKTIMHFTQAPFATEAERDGHDGGWNSMFDKFAEFMLAELPTKAADAGAVPTQLRLKRFFAAPREMVFAAWTNPEMLSQWWGPKGFTSTVHQWDATPGGTILVDMEGHGRRHPMSGKFVDVYPPYRLHFTAAALDNEGQPMFENWNSVFFAEVEGGTEVTVEVHVLSQTETAPQYLKGMEAGWSSSLEKLGELVEKQS